MFLQRLHEKDEYRFDNVIKGYVNLYDQNIYFVDLYIFNNELHGTFIADKNIEKIVMNTDAKCIIKSESLYCGKTYKHMKYIKYVEIWITPINFYTALLHNKL